MVKNTYTFPSDHKVFRDQPGELLLNLDTWDLAKSGAGGIRYNFLRGGFQPYAKIGYGLTWYRLEAGSINGQRKANPDSYRVRLPGFLPQPVAGRAARHPH
ncbi:hypothetical protein [Corallococcus terminator]|uniref:Uncharacterized protein n=1 Tax=Corallococcus terminator TaxID=2316733 RepID=A0A3A8IBL0_9BACT|nr:hypothetical protein [Corallococcus terminator]RKG77224.1 hypothetical protein D7V88_31295 [Corallococcus terminator]